MSVKGSLALVLHAHLPFVRHPESEHYLEERWLFEAITETYIPLLRTFQGLVRDGVLFRVTMTLTPTLLAMLDDALLQQRYLKHIQGLVKLAEQEVVRTAGDSDFAPLARHYLEQFRDTKEFFLQYEGNLIHPFRALQDAGYVEIVTCAATHAFLPFVRSEEAVRAQIATAVNDYQRHFGRPAKGIWLPECGFAPGLDRILREHNLSYFFTGTQAFESAVPRPVFGTTAPIFTPEGVVAFAQDESSSRQVWSSKDGYPGDYDYREYYRDIGYDLDIDLVRDYIHPSGIRHNTGLKYYRITGETGDKAPYHPEMARQKAADHARHFLAERRQQMQACALEFGRTPIVVAPYDAELFGHWWYEGPQWIDFLFRIMHFDQTEIASVTPSDYLQDCGDLQVCDLSMSSWGSGGFGEVWLNDQNDWIYPALHDCETKMVRLADHFRQATPWQTRALNQAARELMLGQSSDYAFIMDHQTMVDYAVKQTKIHVNRFLQLHDMLIHDECDEEMLTALEAIDNLFPSVDYRNYVSHAVNAADRPRESAGRPSVLMLSWEFPPMTVGGLSRHVYDLSRYIVQAGWDVHVFTTRVGDALPEEFVEGVHVHRVDVLQPDGHAFEHWAMQLNLALLEACERQRENLNVRLIHAHDWIVCYAAKTLKERLGLPLVSTIHATEYGRNQGIHSPLQQYIHHLEWELTYESAQVILCSTYMQREVESIFSLPSDKLHVIANGVDPALLQVSQGAKWTQTDIRSHSGPIVLYVGRLVREKGVHILMDAIPSILSACPNATFVILGTGSASADLQLKARVDGLTAHVEFRGFVSDEERNNWLQVADVAVFPSLYEPFGIVALEAMAAGAPVVVSDVGGLGDVVKHGHNGRKAYVGDASSLATQLIEAISDQPKSRAMADVATAELRQFDWREIAKETIRVYDMTCAQALLQGE